MFEFRHLRCFIVVAEELHFGRAAERLNIEQSPLSRAIKDLEYELGAQLFDRTTRSTRITCAGQVFLEDARRVLAVIDGARARVRASVAGFRGHVRLGISDGVVKRPLTALLLRCRDEEPSIQVQLTEMCCTEQIYSLRQGLLDAGLALCSHEGTDILATPVWTHPLSVVLPTQHPLARHEEVALADALQYPLILCHPTQASGCHRQIATMLATVDGQATIAEQTATQSVALMLVSAGYGIGFAVASEISPATHPDVVTRPIAGYEHVLTTYFLRSATTPSPALQRILELTEQHVPLSQDAKGDDRSELT